MFVRTPVELREQLEQLAERENWSLAYAHAYVLRVGLEHVPDPVGLAS